MSIYPLYKHTASKLSESITSGTFVREHASMLGLHEDETLTLKMDEWIKVIVKMGSHLIDVNNFTELSICKILVDSCLMGID